MKRNLIKLYKELVLPLFLTFCFYLLSFTTLLFVNAYVLNLEQTSITSDVVSILIFLCGFLTLMSSPAFIVLLVLLNWSPRLGKKLARRTSLETAYNLKSILGHTSVPIAMLSVTFMILAFLVSYFLYALVALAFLCGFTVLASIWQGLLNEKEEASFLLRKFSENIKASIEKPEASLPSSRRFAKGLKIFNGFLPRASDIPSIDRRSRQVQLVLSLGDKRDLSAMSDHVLTVTESIERDYLEGFDENYRNLTEFLDAFENEKKGVVELAEKVSLRDKTRNFSGEVLKEILVKTIPIIIGILISVLVYMLLGIQPSFST